METPAQPSEGGMFVKVMTDEQMEILRKQIAVYATICEQLVELHKSFASQTDLYAGGGVRLGNLYCDTSVSHKISGRQRWTPTPKQLQILEQMFDQGIGTPTKQKIKEITSELCQHGQISETNVYNWFQNRRARSKRKQQAVNKDESEVESQNKMVDICFQNQSLVNSKTEGDEMPLYGTPNEGIEQLMGKISGNYSPYLEQEQDDY